MGDSDAGEARGRAVEVLLRVLLDHQTLTKALEGHARDGGDPRDEALLRELCFGVLRWQPRLDAVLGELLRHPLKARDQDLRAVLLLGLYQLIYTRVPAYAAVNASVALASQREKAWARGLVNGILRRFQREREALLARADQDDAARLGHPRWLLEAIREAWPHDWTGILEEDNRHPPMSLRVSPGVGRGAYAETLSKAGIEAEPLACASQGLRLPRPVAATRLPGFAQGACSVQDGAAQLAAPLLDPLPGHRVLDACAAPGGKTAHLAEHQPRLAELVAIDQDAQRLALVAENLERVGARASLVRADAGAVQAWWDGRCFDRILLDAPCSATGVIRRHPDIKYLRTANQLTELQQTQARLLRNLWPLLPPGGRLLYATCSVLPEENALRARDFLAAHDDAREVPIAAPWGRPAEVGRQVLPGDDGMDGFYYALFTKV